MKKNAFIYQCLILSLIAFILCPSALANPKEAKLNALNQILPEAIAPLLNNKAKLMANYTPILALRGLAHTKVYRKKGTAHLERYFYEKDSKIPYQKMILNISINSTKWNDRIVEAKGTVNGFPLYYKNVMELSLPRKAKMNIYCNLGAYNLLSLYVESDGTAMTNNVMGYYAGKSVQYFTKHRVSEGTLAGSAYAINVEGVINPKTKLLELVSRGTLDEVQISGSGGEHADGHFEFTERFNDIKVKTYLHVKE